MGIVTNAGGPGILCADACEAGGLSVPELSPELRANLRGLLPSAASVGNPIDLLASAGGESFRTALRVLFASGEVDAIVTIFTPVGLLGARAPAAGLRTGTAG